MWSKRITYPTRSGGEAVVDVRRSKDGCRYDCKVTTFRDGGVPGSPGLFIRKEEGTVSLTVNLLRGWRVKNILAADDSEESVRCERMSVLPYPLKRMLEEEYGVDCGYECDDPPIHVLEQWEKEESFPC